MEKKTIFNSSFISAYLLLLSVSYLWGFWGHFDVNILNFIGVTDIIKSVIWPMIIALVLYLIQVALNVFNGPKANSTVGFSEKTKHEKVQITIQYSYLILMLLSSFVGAAYNYIVGTQMQKYVSIAWPLSFLVCFLIYRSKELLEYIPFKNKAIVCGIICFLPYIFLSRGVYEGDRIKSGKNTFLIESNSICTSDKNNKYRYIDALADKAFALSLKDNSICIFKYEYIKLIKEQHTVEK
ncbi:hypothetical protein [Citrobacter freundii]|uniref:hypothetical protein n=1 Tax=Citrobacter freundii TaxID=546 RepID=UPI001F22887C|nr:hypothetical protein [Citrobacter freundii]